MDKRSLQQVAQLIEVDENQDSLGLDSVSTAHAQLGIVVQAFDLARAACLPDSEVAHDLGLVSSERPGDVLERLQTSNRTSRRQ